jgi:hypothetical protein
MLKSLLLCLLLAACAQQARPAPTLYDCPEVDPAQPRCKVQP